MKNSYLFFLILSVSICNKSFAQAKVNPNEEHDKLYNMQIKSYGVVLPDSLITVLKRYAFQKNINESLVLKSSLFLKIIYNDKLTIIERVEACKYGIRLFSNEDAALPLNIFYNMIKKLEPNK
jgi:hypothetical protein